MLFTHVVAPFVDRKPGSTASTIQKITFASIRHAREQASALGIEVEVLGVTTPSEAAVVEHPVVSVPSLNRTISEVWPFPDETYPVMADILETASSRGKGQYMIYSNMDICLQPYFYVVIRDIINGRTDAALSIARRTITDQWSDSSQLDAMYKEKGKPHPGFDCFVFPRAWVSEIRMGALCVGVPGFDLALLLNLDICSDFQLQLLRNQFLTFHLGDDRHWQNKPELMAYARKEALRLADDLVTTMPNIPRLSAFAYVHAWLGRTNQGLPVVLRGLRRIQQLHSERDCRKLTSRYRTLNT